VHDDVNDHDHDDDHDHDRDYEEGLSPSDLRASLRVRGGIDRKPRGGPLLLELLLAVLALRGLLPAPPCLCLAGI